MQLSSSLDHLHLQFTLPFFSFITTLSGQIHFIIPLSHLTSMCSTSNLPSAASRSLSLSISRVYSIKGDGTTHISRFAKFTNYCFEMTHWNSLLLKMTKIPLFLFGIILCLPPVFSIRPQTSDPCDPTTLPNPQTVRSDQMTVMINGYSESRISLLSLIAATYSASPLVASVLVLWGNPSTPTETLTQLSHNLSISSYGNAQISMVRQPSSSLNSRFHPRQSITTRAVLICDDDVEVDSKSVEFAFRVWSANCDRLIGFFARSHDIDLTRRAWIYTVHPDKYSIVLTKFMIMNYEYLYKYSCGGGQAMLEARRVVDQMRNCEDILMNFVVAEESRAGPVLVGAKKVRDWGDARNEDQRGLVEDRERKRKRVRVREVGLSSRKMDHRKRRGECIREFHRVLGRMPLRYSYGKVVNSVGEQGLCEKGGKLVLCDQQVLN